MSKAQTDIRTTSYDAATANAFGYQGTIDEVLAQIRMELDVKPTIKARAELLHYLGVDRIPSAGPNVELDESPRYGDEPSDEPGRYTLAYAQKHFPESFYRAPDAVQEIADRLANLTESQLHVYRAARVYNGVRLSLAIAERYPYPAVRS